MKLTTLLPLVRNIILDTTGFPATSRITALNWAVSQGTSLYNVQINMPNFSQHYGIEMLSNTGCCGGGSGIMLGDLVSLRLYVLVC